MRISKFAAAVGIVGLLAGPALAQDDNQGPAPASDASGQLDNATNGDQSTGQTFDGGKGPTDAFPDSTRIPEPNPDSAVPSTADDPH